MRSGQWGVAAVCLLLAATSPAWSATGITSEVDAVYAQADALYLDLHRHPELSFQEQQTAAKLAKELRSLGYDVSTGVGRTGVVGVLKNGAGPVVMLRTELDALPVDEQTGLPYASTVRAKNDSGVDVGVMHACGHDIHMASWMATARIMASTRNSWRGTLVLVGQPAEETVHGAAAMLADGLFTRFPRPEFALAVHDDPRAPAGVIGYHVGPILSNVDSARITIFGRGGHGARPDATVDPVVIAARTVLALQTIVSREISPLDAAVVTVGSIHGGTRGNIIPDEVKLELTVRSLTNPVRQHLLSSIERIVKAEAASAGAPREPLIEHPESANALVNDPALTQRVSAALIRELGPEQVKDMPPEMASEDFSEFEGAGVPTLMLRIGATEKSKFEAAMKAGAQPPSLHSALFAPDREPTIKAAVAAEVIALRELMPSAK
ncbi:MAG TPA: amidohydrolase [Steroidobacteraceae bacterium]|nr:amidohydrolase [Steroidobacteraceae bacterium]